MELTLVPPAMVPRLSVVRGWKLGRRQHGQCGGQRGDGIGRARVGKAVAAGASDLGQKAPAAQGLRDCRVGSCAIEDDMRGDAPSQRGLVIEVAHAAQVALAFFSHVAQEKQRCGQFDFGLHQRVRNGQQTNHAGGIVAGAGRFQAVVIEDRVERRIGRKDGVNMSGEDDDRAGAVRGKIAGGQVSKHIADGVDLDVRKAGFAKAITGPGRASVLAKRRPRDGDQVHLPVHHALGIAV